MAQRKLESDLTRRFHERKGAIALFEEGVG